MDGKTARQTGSQINGGENITSFIQRRYHKISCDVTVRTMKQIQQHFLLQDSNLTVVMVSFCVKAITLQPGLQKKSYNIFCIFYIWNEINCITDYGNSVLGATPSLPSAIPVNHRFGFWKRFFKVLVLKTFSESLENVFEFYRRFEDVLITFLKLENGLACEKSIRTFFRRFY